MRHVVACLLFVCGPLVGVLQAQASATAILDHIRVTGRRAIDFHAVALPETVYVGQQATYQVAVMLSQDAKSRLRRNPEFLPPELRGLLAYELGSPVRVGWRRYGDNEYESHIFQRALFPVAPGRQMVPAPQLSYALPQSSSYFSREERFVVKAESAQFVVKPLPVADRPADFNGAVGVFRSTVKLDSTTARVGDPLVLTMRVQGTGNVKLLPRPTIEIDWASVVPGTERVQVDSGGPLVKGTKEFDWILTPTRDGTVSVPALRYSYFDPYKGEYAVALSDPNDLTVRAGSLATIDDEDVSSSLLPLRELQAPPANRARWFGASRPSSLGWLAIVFMLCAPLPALWVWWKKRSTTLAANRAPHQPQRGGASTPRDASPREVARVTRRHLLDALAKRFEQTPQELLSRLQVARVLRRGGVTRATTRSVLTLLQQLDVLGFANDEDHQQTDDASPSAVDAILQLIDAEAMPQGRHIRTRRSVPISTARRSANAVANEVTGAALMLFCVVSLSLNATSAKAQRMVLAAPRALVAAQDATSDSALALRATEAYAKRAFTEASQRFGALADVYPHDPSILVNWGTAAWALGDTVSAVIAWQRAARMEPFASDVQERMRLLPAGARGGIADVPMVPVTLLGVSAVVLWIVGWGLVVVWFRRAQWGMAAVSMIALALASAGGAWWGARVLDASALSVVLRPETMRLAPGIDANAMGGVSTGDVVRVVESRETWLHVVHADGRRGWLPVGRVAAMHSTLTAR